MALDKGGVRLRTTLLATLVVTLALAAGSIALFFIGRAAFISSVESAALARAESTAALAVNDLLPARLPIGGDVLASQLITADGAVVAWSAGADNLEALDDESLAAGERRTYREADLADVIEDAMDFEVEGEVLVVALGTDTPNGPATVVVASSLDTDDNIDVFLELLYPAIPAIVIVVAAVTWWVTGRALRPVEDMRVEAEAIGSTDLHRRLPLPASKDEIRRLAETMNRMLDRLEASAEEHYRFVADASHELKSPVAAIRTMVEVAQANPDSIDFDSFTADLLAEDVRLEQMVTDLLTLAQSDERGLRLEKVEVDLDDLLREDAERVAGRSAVPISTSAVTPIRLDADPARLHQVVRNLLDNAVTHAATGVWVTSSPENGEAVVTVSDDGPGIPDSSRERIFGRFVRLDAGRGRSEGGTGLGLAVARAVVEAHGGALRVVDPLHDGATFEFRLPT